jgi:hypothetical protein
MATKKVNIDIIAKDKSKAALRGVQGSLDKVKKSVFNVRNALIGLGAGLAIRSLVKTGMEIEGLQVRLKFLFGSAKEGSKAFDEMAKFAAKVPFSLEQIQQGSGVLAVVSKDAEELARNMELTGNVAAVTGLDFKTTAEQIQRSLSAGISAADLFRDRGVKSMLGFKAGAVVSVEETAEAFKRVFGANGQFGGATDELAKTFEGTLSMIGDKFFNFKRNILESGFFPELKKQFGDLDKFLQQNQRTLNDISRTIGVALAVSVKKLADGLIVVKDNFELIKKIFIAIVGVKIISTLINISRAIQGIVIATTSLVALSGPAGWALIASAVVAAGGAYIGLNKALDNLLDTVKDTNQEFNDMADRKLYGKAIADMRNKANAFNESLTEILTTLREEQSQLKKTMDAYSEYAFHRMRLQRQIVNQEKEDLDRSIAQHKVYGQTRLLANEKLFEKEREQAMNNWQKMKDAALANESAKAEIRKAATQHTIKEARSTLEILAGMNENAFKAFKALQIAEATIDTYRAAVAAFRNFGGWPFGVIAAAATVAKGMAMVAQINSINYSKREQGGPVIAGKSYMVGEGGAEMFTPSTNGNIESNNSKPVTVNFNINTVDASGFNQLLVNSRGVIINMINSAVNEKGRAAII